jgi:DNA-binding NarL/FixJ family response regulator
MSKITKRQIQVLNQLSLGKSNRDIGKALNIQEGTVKVHIGKLFVITNSKTRIGLASNYIANKEYWNPEGIQ